MRLVQLLRQVAHRSFLSHGRVLRGRRVSLTYGPPRVPAPAMQSRVTSVRAAGKPTQRHHDGGRIKAWRMYLEAVMQMDNETQTGTHRHDNDCVRIQTDRQTDRQTKKTDEISDCMHTLRCDTYRVPSPAPVPSAHCGPANTTVRAQCKQDSSKQTATMTGGSERGTYGAPRGWK